jgi:hypothetical protein
MLIPPVRDVGVLPAVRLHLKVRPAGRGGGGYSDKDMGTWIAVGIAIGVGMGVAMDNVGMGIGIGIAIGIAMGGVAGARKQRDRKPPDPPPR